MLRQAIVAALSLLMGSLGALAGDHWAFRPPVRPNHPQVKDSAWVRTPIDAYILAKIEAAGLKPAPEADRLTFLRRVTFDLTGLPPTVVEQEDFLNDKGPNAYEKVVDRLLASPHYGERWAQHWLDVVRYAESNGYEADGDRPHAWRYRDYVVRSFHKDKPYDRFLTEQIAGDLLAKEAKGDARNELLIATGMHRCGPVHVVGGNTDPEELRQEMLIEMVNGLGSAVLGVTIGCCRCHDHKFDPLPQADYYRLQAFFAGTVYKESDISTESEREAHRMQKAAIDAKIAPLRAKVAALDGPYRTRLSEAKRAVLDPEYRSALAVPSDKRTKEQMKLAEHAQILIKVTWDEILAAMTPTDLAKRKEFRDEIHALEAQLPYPPAHAWSVTENEKPPVTHVLKRGEVKQKGKVVQPGVPQVLVGANKHVADSKRGSRIELARWITRTDHPLTSRVWVNRVWKHHLGRGLVATPNDFGTRGTPPTHPELLDWLATEFVRNGWSTNHLHRLIVLSATYRQGEGDTGVKQADPDNRLWTRHLRRRLEGEVLRDAMLAVAGTLNREIGGPMVRVPLEPEVYDLIFTEGEPDGLWHVTPDPKQHTRRSIYLFAKRNVRQPILEAFDQPDTLIPCGERPVSTFAPQALILMNGPLARSQASAFARRLLCEAEGSTAARVTTAYRIALGRPPRQQELATATAFLERQTARLRDRLVARQPIGTPDDLPAGVDPAEAAALADFALALVNSNEFVYVR